MAFFKFRKRGDEHPANANAVESVEAMRTRARHRLIGAAVLVLVGVLGFPLLFESQPRPVAVDVSIEIPDKSKVKPLLGAAVTPPPAVPASEAEKPTETAPAKTAPLVEAAPVAPKPVAAAAAPQPAPKPTPQPTPKTPTAVPKIDASVSLKPAAKPVEKPPQAKTPVKIVDKPIAKPATTRNTGAKAQALLDGKDSGKSNPAAGRFVVQVGAYVDVHKAREARSKLEKAKFKTYTQVVKSSEGRRIRVRVGPFETKAQADKIAEKIKRLGLPSSVLEL